jgi:hypothetical protein
MIDHASEPRHMRVLGVVRGTICDGTPPLKDEKQGYGGNEMLEEVET